MKVQTIAALVTAATLSFTTISTAHAETAQKTKYPVILAHGTAGWDSLLGLDYFGDEWGTFALDGCSFLEIGCNGWVSGDQKAAAFQVTSFASSETRGLELANQIESYMATNGVSYVNIVGHSQGGMDARKAAHLLKSRKNYQVVKDLISISSPHRGTSYAKKGLDKYARNGDQFCWNLPWNGSPSTDPCGALIEFAANNIYDIATTTTTTQRNNMIAALKQFVYDDYDPNDGETTGGKTYGQNYNLTTSSGAAIAARVGSFVTAQDDFNVTPLLAALHVVLGNFNADGDAYCSDDCDNDGAVGKGDGSVYDMDDDGLVPITSQQMGTRLSYASNDATCGWKGIIWSCWDPLDSVGSVSSTGYVSSMNSVTSTQMTSHEGVISQDHLDVMSIGPDTFDELEFYASIANYIAKGGN